MCLWQRVQASGKVCLFIWLWLLRWLWLWLWLWLWPGSSYKSSRLVSSRLGLTIIVNLAYGFFIVASVSLPPPRSLLLTANHIYCQHSHLAASVSQSLCGLRTECNQIKLHKLLFNYYWHWPSRTAAQLPSCPVAQLPSGHSDTDPRWLVHGTDTQTIIIGCGCSKCPQVVTIFSKHTHTHIHRWVSLCGVWYMWVWWDLVSQIWFGISYELSCIIFQLFRVH